MDYNNYRWHNPEASGDYMTPAAFAAMLLEQGYTMLAFIMTKRKIVKYSHNN
jgi:hypothetical protein